MNKIKIIIADDHKLVRSGFRKILESESNMEVIAEFENGAEVVEYFESKKPIPSLVILDYNMPELNGIDTAKKIKAINEDIKVLILTMHEGEKIIFEGLSAEINGLIYKETDIDEFIKAVNDVNSGSDYFSSEVKNKIFMYHKDKKSKKINKFDENKIPLSAREIEIIKLISLGMSSNVIAEKLFLSPFTIVKHRKNILKKLALKNSAEVINFAKDNNII